MIYEIENDLYIRVIDISKFCEVSFCKYCLFILKVCFVFKNRHYTYIPLHMHKKTLKTLGNEKEEQQIKFYQKSSASRFSGGQIKIYFTRLTRLVLKK